MLAVQRSSLYSYVSRGLLRAQKMPGGRGSRYLRTDVMQLARQRQAVRNPARLAQSTLNWGQPVLPSSITLVRDGRLYYRGRDAVRWAGHATLEQTAQLMWSSQQEVLATARRPCASGHSAPGTNTPTALPPAPSVLAAWHAIDPTHHDHAPTLLYAMCIAVLGDTPASSLLVHRRLQQHWRAGDEAAEILRRALVLCADHELNASSFAARVVASTGASLHACVGAGLAALSGPLHGGVTGLIDEQWDEWHADGLTLTPLLSSRLESNWHDGPPAHCAGFGHLLYPQGDPRGRALLQCLPPDERRQRLLDRVDGQTGLQPSLDYALVAVQRALQLPRGAAFALFALGRTVGWIAHALEQRASGQLIRPRAVYNGVEPDISNPPRARPTSRLVRFG